MDIKKVKISSLIEDPSNAMSHSPKNIDAIKGSLSKFRQQKPIVIGKDNIVIAGNGTLQAAKAIGLEEIYVVQSDLKGSDATAYAIADNRTGELAEWDSNALASTLSALKQDGFDLESIGFEDIDLEQWLKPPAIIPGCDEDEVPEPEDTICKPGDLWLLGEHRLLCGDSTNIQNVERLMGDEKADMVFTDPPYGLGGYGGRNSMNLTNDDLSGANLEDMISCILPWREKAKDTFVWLDQKTIPNFYSALGVPRDLIVWKKPWPSMGRGYRGQYELCMYFGSYDAMDQFDIWDINYKSEGISNTIQRRDEMLHPTQKPVALAEKAITNHQPDNILDLFLGSGSTLIACEKTKRRCFGMEIDSHYCNVIITRWEKYTGNKAKLDG